MAKLKLAVLISGSGTNLQALIDACEASDFGAELVLVLSNKAEAFGLERARKAGIPTRVISHRDFADRERFDAALSEAIAASGAELVCLAGFMRVLSARFVTHWQDRLINIHPALLPTFKGLDTHARALAAGVKITGCTVHFVRPEIDAGPIIVQAAVAVHDDDTPESLARRVLAEEHRIYPLAVRLIAQGRVRIAGDVVRILDAPVAGGALINPRP